MDNDFQELEVKAADKRRVQDRDDYNNEASGNEVGRMQRFGFAQSQDIQIKDKEKRERSQLQMLLMDAAYQAAYNDAMQSLSSAEDAVYTALLEASTHLSQAQSDLDDALENAQTLPNDTKIFRAEDGAAIFEDGRKLDEATSAAIVWRADAPTWEQYQALKEAHEAAQARYEQVSEHEQRVSEIREELKDEDNPASLDRVEVLAAELKGITDSVMHENKSDAKLSYTAVTPESVPDLGL